MIQILLLTISLFSLTGLIFYFPAIVHRELIVKKITNRKPVSFGELYYQQRDIIIKGLLVKQSFSLTDLKVVKAYCQISYSLEDYCCIDFVFKNGQKILFDCSKKEQQELLNVIFTTELKIEPIDCIKDFSLEGEESNIIYRNA